MPLIFWMLARDVVLPVGVYAIARVLGIGEAPALLLGGAVPVVVVVVTAIRRRRVDALAAIVGCLFALGLIALTVTGDPRTVLAADSIPTIALGAFFIASVWIGRAIAFSLLLGLLSRGDPANEAFWRQAWDDAPSFRHALRTLTAGWGGLLIAEGVVRLALIPVLPFDVMVVASRTMQAVLVLAMIGFAGWYARRTGLGIRAYLDSIKDPPP